MKRVKIAFFDIDGTLIDMKKKKISEKTLETLKGLQKRGIKICIATGRSPMQLPHFPGLEFDAFLTYNGSCCFDREEAGDIFSNPLKREDVRTIIENAEKLGRPLALATKTRLAANGADEDLLEYFAFGGAELKIAEDFDAVAAREEIYQIMMGCRRDEYQAAMEHVKEARITAWWDRAVDIIPRNGGKGLAVLKILEHYRLSREEALAFGDGNNDIEMIEAAGWGVAMGNVSPELKAAADDICGSAAEDGIYHYCREHGLL